MKILEKNLEKELDKFLGKKIKTKEDLKVEEEGFEEEGFEEVCDKETGECYTIKMKDGLIERVNKKMVTEDGRTLLMD